MSRKVASVTIIVKNAQHSSEERKCCLCIFCVVRVLKKHVDLKTCERLLPALLNSIVIVSFKYLEGAALKSSQFLFAV